MKTHTKPECNLCRPFRAQRSREIGNPGRCPGLTCGWPVGPEDKRETDMLLAVNFNQRLNIMRVTFQDELRAILKRHGIEFDERYVWD